MQQVNYLLPTARPGSLTRKSFMKCFILPGFLLLLLAGNNFLRAQTGPGKPTLLATPQPVKADSAVSYQGMTTALPASRDYATLHVKPTGKRVEYDLTVAETTVNITGKSTTALTINGHTPGPTLAFTEGDVAVIRVHNTLKTETSIHWHGILVPSRQDGVAYLNTPPIGPGQSHTFEFPLVQSGTFWYHSHTPFQEHRGEYGAIVIQPQRPTVKADHELVLLLADWTNERPAHVLKNLKRRTEWYAIKKGNAQPLNQIIKHRALRAYLTQSFNRMPPMDISDVAYQRFLMNGRDTTRFEQFKPGETVRLRVVNAAGGTYFHVQFAGGNLQVIAADGIPVQPVGVDRMLMAIAETYDFLVTIPASGAYELRASAQDGSGYSSAFLGRGKRVYAPKIPKPDLYQITRTMSQMPGGNRSGLSFGKYKPLVRLLPARKTAKEASPPAAMNMPGMAPVPVASASAGMAGMPGMTAPAAPAASASAAGMPMAMFDKYNTFNYQQLRSVEKTVFPANRPVREVTLNLSGDMRRYIWGFNGKTLSGADAILVRRGEIVRFRLVNATMMFHPLHLHGHFFRVLNGQGDYSPLKHTVNLSPMETVVIEFLADEENDWFFHCHILYHLLGGMGQVVHYVGTTPDADVVAARASPASPMKDPAGDKAYYFWGQLDAGFPTSYLALNYSNQRNAFIIGADVNRRGQFELDADYERYLSQYLRVFGGIDAGNEQFLRRPAANGGDAPTAQRIVRPVAGVRYLLPFLIDSEVKLDARGNVRFQLTGEQQLVPRLIFSYQGQWLVRGYTRLHLDLDYLLTKNLALFSNYDTRYRDFSGGLSYRF